MFLSKHKNGFYYIYYSDINGNRNKKSTRKKLKHEANNFLVTFSEKIESDKRNKTKSIHFKKFIFDFLKYSESIHSPNTTNTFKTTFNATLSYFGDITLMSITSTKIQEFLQYRIINVSKYQARKDLINLSSAFNKAVTERYLVKNPCIGIKRIKIPEKQPKFFTEAELEKLLNVTENQDIKDLTIFAVNTGLRQMELLTLQWDQINFRDKLLTLDNRNHLTKSKKIRTIPLNISSMQIIDKREAQKTSEYVFTYLNAKITQDQISKVFKKYVLRAGINPKLNFHSLRHTFASWLVQRGVSIYQVSKLLGHASVTTTQIYAHVNADDLRASVELLE